VAREEEGGGGGGYDRNVHKIDNFKRASSKGPLRRITPKLKPLLDTYKNGTSAVSKVKSTKNSFRYSSERNMASSCFESSQRWPFPRI